MGKTLLERAINALSNLENDNGSIPKPIWDEAQEVIKEYNEKSEDNLQTIMSVDGKWFKINLNKGTIEDYLPPLEFKGSN